MTCCFGLEDEYTLLSAASFEAQTRRVAAFLKAARAQCSARLDPAQGHGFFDDGGSRYSADGLHGAILEFSSRECADPRELATVVARAERRIALVAASRGERYAKIPVGLDGATHSSHMNFAVPSVAAVLPFVASHLSSLPVLVGFGGLSSSGSFLVSPRGHGTRNVYAGATATSALVSSRRGDSFASGVERLHVSGADHSLTRSDPLSMQMRFGTTALLLIAAEVDAAPFASLMPRDVLEALHVSATDVAGTARFALDTSGSVVRPAEHQHAIALAVMDVAARRPDRFPRWSDETLRAWVEITGQAVRQPAGQWRLRTDHGLRKYLLDRVLAERQVEWSDLAALANADRASLGARAGLVKRTRDDLQAIDIELNTVGSALVERICGRPVGELPAEDAPLDSILVPRARFRAAMARRRPGGHHVAWWSFVDGPDGRYDLSDPWRPCSIPSPADTSKPAFWLPAVPDPVAWAAAGRAFPVTQQLHARRRKIPSPS